MTGTETGLFEMLPARPSWFAVEGGRIEPR